MRTSNPALSDKVFEQAFLANEERMTVSGTVNKSGLLILLLCAAAVLSWQNAFSAEGMINIPVWYLPLIIGAFVVSLIIVFLKKSAPYLAPIYALGQGLLIGTVSAFFESKYPGIAIQAALATIGTFIALLIAYRSGVIRATENFKLGVVAATGGIAIVYLIDMGMRFFGHQMPYLHESGMIGIGISVFIVIIAALNLVLDFDFIEKGAERGAPKYMEWYAAFGLLVTLVWLYLEMLKLLAKARKK